MTANQRSMYAAGRHACQRLRERYGLSITLLDYAYLCGQLQQLDEVDGLNFDGPNEHHRMRARVRLKVLGVQTVCIYARVSGLIVTFLPRYVIGGGSVELGERAWKRRQARHRKRYIRRAKYGGRWA